MATLKTLKTLTIAAALVAGATSLAMAQNGPPTGGDKPVAGGAANDSTNTGMSSTQKSTAKSAEHPSTMNKSMNKDKTQ